MVLLRPTGCQRRRQCSASRCHRVAPLTRPRSIVDTATAAHAAATGIYLAKTPEPVNPAAHSRSSVAWHSNLFGWRTGSTVAPVKIEGQLAFVCNFVPNAGRDDSGRVPLSGVAGLEPTTSSSRSKRHQVTRSHSVGHPVRRVVLGRESHHVPRRRRWYSDRHPCEVSPHAAGFADGVADRASSPFRPENLRRWSTFVAK